MKSGQIILPKSSRWGVFALSFVVMFIFTGMTAGLMTNMAERPRVLFISVLQGLLVFILPTLLTWFLTSAEPTSEIGLRSKVSTNYWIWIVLLYLLAYPALCQTVFWNEHTTFPASMSGLEETLRKWEDDAAETTLTILNVDSFGAMLVNILIVGLFTGLAEEMFFRAGCQKMLIRSGMRPTVAIWLSALIFSAIHFQFFGFVPRLLLGAMFGYVYYRTGSIWTSALLHGLNNSVVVVTSWMATRGMISGDIDSIFINENGFPWIFTISAVLTIIFIFFTGPKRVSEFKSN